eukprot:TRINITY_DN40190_c0_g1_i1.p1 TRINITY_DN40190_c0_g1~~TRINITY_DN40190_c0_g1_i1.p1  ORF type:complete len:645 (-),score=64.99 TRINITY_DN40190_c0_g1_i1:303-2237(-)
MGAAARKAWRRMIGQEDSRVVMFGLDAAGKTTILYKMKLGESITTMPTIGFNVETLCVGTQNVVVWDLGLRDKARPLLRVYMEPVPSGIIFVVDANDPDRYVEAMEFLRFGIDSILVEHASAPPLLIFVNKLDLSSARSIDDTYRELGLQSYTAGPLLLQGCSAVDGNGLSEGLQWLMSARNGDASATKHSLQPLPKTQSQIMQPEIAEHSPELLANRAAATIPTNDEQFLCEFNSRQLPYVGDVELGRLSFLHRTRIGSSSARITLEIMKQSGYIDHVTRAYFWITRAYSVPLASVCDSCEFMVANEALLPGDAAAQDAALRRAFSDEVLADPIAALEPLPPDLHDQSNFVSRESDDDFILRVETAQLLEGELNSFRELVLLSFALLQRYPRRNAIERMDQMLRRLAAGWQPLPPLSPQCSRPFHETKQYVALQLAHAALTAHPELKTASSSDLAVKCPDILNEDYILRYYSTDALSRGCDSFVVPDLQALPSVIEVHSQTWYSDMDDETFLASLQTGSIPYLGMSCLSRCAYLFLRQGRRQALARLLAEVTNAREHADTSRCMFAHETLAYFTLHMVHYYSIVGHWKLSESFASFASCNKQVVDPLLYRSYYSDILVHSKEARDCLVLPDLCPLPNLVSNKS